MRMHYWVLTIFLFASIAVRANFVVDTRDDFKINDVRCGYCNGEYGNSGGRRATFLSGPQVYVRFTIDAGTQEHPAKWFLVNGEQCPVDWFSMNVGALSPGDKVEVIAVDYFGVESQPFRVNFDIAALPTGWTLNHVSVREKSNCVIYQGAFEPLAIFDAVTDVLDMFGDVDFAIYPTIQLEWSFDSNTAQARYGSGLGQKEQSMGRFGPCEIRYELNGGRVVQWSPIMREYIELEHELGVGLSAKTDLFSARIPQTLYLVYVKAGIEGNGEFKLTYNDDFWRGDLAFDPLFAIVGTVGAGVQGLACVEGYVKGGMTMTGQIPGTPNIFSGLGLKLYYGWKAVALGFVSEDSGSRVHWIYGQDTSRANRLLTSLALPSNGVNFKLMGRDYSMKEPNARRLLSARSAAVDTSEFSMLERNGYPTPTPSMLADGVGDVIAYLLDDGSRSAINRTKLVVRNGISNEWGAASVVMDDGTADFMPSISNAGEGRIMVAWANAAKALNDADTLETMCSNLEIAVGVRNDDGIWKCQNLTENLSLDMSPILKANSNGTAVVVWMRNESNSFVGDCDKPSEIMASFYRDGVWSVPESIEGKIGGILAYDVAYDGTCATVVYAKNCGTNISRIDDADVFSATYDGIKWLPSVRMTCNGVGDLRPYVMYVRDGDARMTWLESNGTSNLLCVARAGDVESIVKINNSFAIKEDYRITEMQKGRILLHWQKESEKGLATDVFCAVLDPVAATVSDANALIATEDVERNLAGVIGADGILRVAYESVAVSTNEQGNLEYGAVDLKVFRRKSLYDLQIDSSAFAFDETQIDERRLALRSRIVNAGAFDATNVIYRVFFDNGENRYAVGVVNTNLAAGASIDIVFPWCFQTGYTNYTFIAEIDPYKSLEDDDRDNNNVVWSPRKQVCDLEFSNLQCVTW